MFLTYIRIKAQEHEAKQREHEKQKREMESQNSDFGQRNDARSTYSPGPS